MNYTNRKDGGSYIAPEGDKTVVNQYYTHPIMYIKEVAELATKTNRMYRELFLELHNKTLDNAKDNN